VIVELPEPFDFALSTERFGAFGLDLANAWDGEALTRVLAGRAVRLTAAPGGVDAEPGGEEVAAAVRSFLGAEHDLAAFAAFAAEDPVLGPVERALRGFRPALVPDAWEMLVTSITAQQVSLRAATAIRNRLIEAYGPPPSFPARERVAALGADDLTALGFSRAKAAATVALARADLDLDGLAAFPDDEVSARLVALPGIGEWTADWFLARHLGRPRAWPAGDLGVRKALGRFLLAGGDPSLREARVLGERFAPYESLAAQYLLLAMRRLP